MGKEGQAGPVMWARCQAPPRRGQPLPAKRVPVMQMLPVGACVRSFPSFPGHALLPLSLRPAYHRASLIVVTHRTCVQGAQNECAA